MNDFEFEVCRGETFLFRFQRKDAAGEVITTEPAAIWFTVKKNMKIEDEFVIQKTIGNGIAYGDDTYWHVHIEPSDTEELNPGVYYCDIKIAAEEGLTRKFILKPCRFVVSEVVTRAVNECGK